MYIAIPAETNQIYKAAENIVRTAVFIFEMIRSDIGEISWCKLLRKN
jgi:hypothetical protein